MGTIGEEGGKLIKFWIFFFHPFATNTIGHDSRDPAVELRNYRATGHTLCCRVWLVSFYWRLLVSPWTPILRIRDYVVVHTPWVCELLTRSFRETIEAQSKLGSIDTNRVSMELWALAPGILFVFKIYFENPVSDSALYMYIHVYSIGALRCINRWIFRSDSRWNSWLSKVSTPRAFNEI